MIATLIPAVAAGNSFPLLRTHGTEEISSRLAALMLANLNSLPLDFVLRQKLQGQNLNWYIIEQLPVVPLDSYETISFGSKKASEIAFEAVLELTYTSHDMEPFALGRLVDHRRGTAPFIWDENRRLKSSELMPCFFNFRIKKKFATLLDFPMSNTDQTSGATGPRTSVNVVQCARAGNPEPK